MRTVTFSAYTHTETHTHTHTHKSFEKRQLCTQDNGDRGNHKNNSHRKAEPILLVITVFIWVRAAFPPADGLCSFSLGALGGNKNSFGAQTSGLESCFKRFRPTEKSQASHVPFLVVYFLIC